MFYKIYSWGNLIRVLTRQTWASWNKTDIRRAPVTVVSDQVFKKINFHVQSEKISLLIVDRLGIQRVIWYCPTKLKIQVNKKYFRMTSSFFNLHNYSTMLGYNDKFGGHMNKSSFKWWIKPSQIKLNYVTRVSNYDRMVDEKAIMEKGVGGVSRNRVSNWSG